MGNADRLQIIRECYRAYETGDRGMLERHLAADFTFYSPADVGIDRALLRALLAQRAADRRVRVRTARGERR